MREYEKFQNWFDLLSLQLGKEYDLEKRAYTCGALLRKRALSSAKDLLQLCLVYGFSGMSLRSTAAFAEANGITKISDVALMNRLQKSVGLLSDITNQLISNSNTNLSENRSLKIVDASSVSCQGATGTDARLHLCFDPRNNQACQLELTDVHGGETLKRYSFTENDIVLADAAYARNGQILHVLDQGADVILRCGINTLALKPLKTGEKPPRLADWLMDIDKNINLVDETLLLRPVKGMRKDAESFPVRIIAQRLSLSSAKRRAKRAKRKAQKNRCKQRSSATVASEWIILVSTLPKQKYSANHILNIYRYRWQVELAFKRLKSQTGFAELRAKNKELIQVHLFSNLILALIAERNIEMTKYAEDTKLLNTKNISTPTRPKSIWRLMKLTLAALKASILSLTANLSWATNLSSINRNLRDPPRKRLLHGQLIRTVILS